jgi:hypothetical protein
MISLVAAWLNQRGLTIAPAIATDLHIGLNLMRQVQLTGPFSWRASAAELSRDKEH